MDTSSEQKIEKLWKPFVVLFVFSFLIINWADVFWIFNYRAVSGFALEMFQTAMAENGAGEEDSFADLATTSAEAIVSQAGEDAQVNTSESKPIVSEDKPKIQQYTENGNTIKIPKIGISAPLIFVSNSDNGYLHNKLDSGVVHYPGSSMPGEQGQTIVLGHSAPANWPKIKYDWVFSRLNELNKGDQIILNYNNQKYIYSVIRKVFLNKGEEMPEQGLTNNNNTLISISCWPPGKDYKRIAVESELID